MSNPEGQQKILELYSQNKESLTIGAENERVRGDMREIAEKNNLKLEFVNDSPTSELGKTLARIGGDIKMMFGIADSGLMAVDGDGKWKVKTCFDGSQEILTPKGNRRIDSLQIGEEVTTINEETGEIETRKITETFVHDVKTIHKIEYENDVTVTTTWNHPFGVLNAGDRSRTSGVTGDVWVKAEDLKTGDRSITKRSIRRAKLKSRLARSSVLSVASISMGENSYNRDYQTNWKTEKEGTLGIKDRKEVNRNQKVYNIEMEGNHNYFIKVGNEYVSVHNYPQDEGGALKNLRSEISILNKENRIIPGTDAVVRDRELANQIDQLDKNATNYEKTNGSLKTDLKELLSKSNAARKVLDLAKINNKLLVDVIKSPKSDGLPGIKEIREALRGNTGELGFTRNQMEAITKWANGYLSENALVKAGYAKGIGTESNVFKALGSYQKGEVAGLHGIALEAARNTVSAEQVANARRILTETETKITLKTKDIQTLTKKFTEEANVARRNIEIYVKENLYANKSFTEYLSSKNLLLSDSQFKKQNLSYESGKGKELSENNKNHMDGLKEVLKPQDRQYYEQLLSMRDKIAPLEETRRKATEAKLATDAKYQKLKVELNEVTKEYNRLSKEKENLLNRLDLTTLTKDLPTLLKFEQESKKAEGRIKSVVSTMENRNLEVRSSIPSKLAYGPEIHENAIASAKQDLNYQRNETEIKRLETLKDGNPLSTGFKTPEQIAEKIRELNKENKEIVKNYEKTQEKDLSQFREILANKGLEGADEYIQKKLNALKYTAVNEYYDKATGQFKGPLEKFNNPEIEVDKKADIANNLNTSDTKKNFTPGPEYMRQMTKEVASDHERSLSEYNKRSSKDNKIEPLHPEEVVRLAKQAFTSPAEIFAGAHANEAFDPTKPEHVISLVKEMVKGENANQRQFGPLATQLGAVFDMIRTQVGGDERKFTPDPSIQNDPAKMKVFNDVKEWIFSGKSPSEMGNETAAALCRVFHNYVQAVVSGRVSMHTTLAEFMTHKIRIGAVAMGKNAHAPVLDKGFTNGYSNHLTIRGTSGNDFENFTFGEGGKPLGITSAIPPKEVQNFLKDLPIGAVEPRKN
ncbi:intein N-terminal splicing domain protein [Leptospira inadai serovar Lyme str. 10]|uniref:Intein N-terminal splicing domain protein n=2 Tax=Leptospira inadai serovar Lyme TaxID=293084 RepID=V6HCL2_9LEPT|nr:intein N-terminal splicing domain protein [Leptospira inadai]EQA37382.1 intein N-terminal splicing domain protein [Leptospira inadai serovar Lyme str. 10]